MSENGTGVVGRCRAARAGGRLHRLTFPCSDELTLKTIRFRPDLRFILAS